MKKLILPLLLLIGSLGFSQTKSVEEIEIIKKIEETKVESVDVVVTVDNIEELESTFTIDDVKEVFDLSEGKESVSFKLVCNGEVMSSGKKSKMTYIVEGTSDDKETFVQRVEKIRNAAIKYYKNKE
ncbi:hypothetical protein [Winogradskyella sp.]|uniref:hypothetical protein n=1 Tax=Winogradskyella sp. TaxID=1883156 RepID=UPI003F6966C3